MRVLREIASTGIGKKYAERISENEFIHYYIPLNILLLVDPKTVMSAYLEEEVELISHKQCGLDLETCDSYVGQAVAIKSVSGKYDYLFQGIPQVKSVIYQYISDISYTMFKDMNFFKKMIVSLFCKRSKSGYTISTVPKFLLKLFFKDHEAKFLNDDWRVRELSMCAYFSIRCDEDTLEQAYERLGQSIERLRPQIIAQLTPCIQKVAIADTVGDGKGRFVLLYYPFFEGNFSFLLEDFNRLRSSEESDYTPSFPGFNLLSPEGSVGPWVEGSDPSKKYTITEKTIDLLPDLDALAKKCKGGYTIKE